MMTTVIYDDYDEIKAEKLRKRSSLLFGARMSFCCGKKH